MTSRKSVIKGDGGHKGGFNYQKEVKQLKKDLRLRDEKITLLNKELKYKKETIDLLQSGMNTKDEQLQLKDKELINFETNLKLLNEKIEAIEKHNDELKSELMKQTKLANAATKKQNIAEQNNMNLLTQINSLAQNLNNLKNVNMALSSQLTMTMSAAQNTMQRQLTAPVMGQQQYNNNNNNNDNIEHKQQHRESVDEDDEDNNNDNASSRGGGDDRRSSVEESGDVLNELPETTKRSKPEKKRKSVSTKGRKRTQSGGSSMAKMAKYEYQDWDDKNGKTGDNNDNDHEREKTKRKKDKSDREKPPHLPKQKSHRRESRSASKAKKHKKHIEPEETVKEEEEDFGNATDDSKINQDDYDFGNAPIVKKKKKKDKSGGGGDDENGVYFDTYLDGIESDKLKITKNGTLVAMDYFTDSLYIISSNGFTSGKHEWEIKTLKTGDLADEIGVCSSWDDLNVNGNGIADMGSSQLGARAVYANDPSTGVAFHDAYDDNNKLTYDKKFKKKGSQPSEFVWGKGDIIKVTLNLNKSSIKFYLNGKQVGRSIGLTKDLTYYPIICAYGSCSYQVISYS